MKLIHPKELLKKDETGITKFNTSLALKITNGVGTMWTVVYYLYVYIQLFQVHASEEIRPQNRLLELARSQDPTRIRSRFMGSSWQEGSISSSSGLSITERPNSRRVSYRPLMQKSFLYKSRPFRSSHPLRKQPYKSNYLERYENLLQTWSRVYERKYL